MNYTIQTEAIHLTVHYVEGSESPYRFYAELRCVSITIHETFHGSNGMINTSIISPNELCNLLVTDADAMSFTCLVAAVTVENITIPIRTGSKTTTTTTTKTTTTTTTATTTTTTTTTATTTVNYSLVHNTDPGAVNMTLLVAGILVAAFTGMILSVP